MEYLELVKDKTKLDICDRQNLKEKCPFFPCHDLDKEQFDCRTCYCPLYDICSNSNDDNKFGGYILESGILACEKCSFIHKKEIVEKIIDLRSKGVPYKKIYNIIKSTK